MGALTRLSIGLTPPLARPANQVGPALYAFVLELLGDPLAGTLHARRHKPFAVRLGPGGGSLEVGVADQPVADALRSGVDHPGPRRLLGRDRVTALIAVQEADWQDLLVAPSQPRWTVEFLTPTTMRTSRGEGVRRCQPLPAVELVFSSLATTWDRLAPHPVSPTTRALLARHGAVAAYACHTCDHLVVVKAGRRHYETGFVGTAVFQVLDPPAASSVGLRESAALLHLGAFLGVGDRTHLGMGAIRLEG